MKRMIFTFAWRRDLKKIKLKKSFMNFFLVAFLALFHTPAIFSNTSTGLIADRAMPTAPLVSGASICQGGELLPMQGLSATCLPGGPNLTLYSENFDSGPSGWSLTNAREDLFNCLSPTGNTIKLMSIAGSGPRIAITPGVTVVNPSAQYRLEFDYWTPTSVSTNNCERPDASDVMEVQYSTSGTSGPWTTLLVPSFTSDAVNHIVIDLPCVSSLTTFHFRFIQTNYGSCALPNCTIDNHLVDNVTVEEMNMVPNVCTTVNTPTVHWFTTPSGGTSIASGLSTHVFDPTSIPVADGGVDPNVVGVTTYYASCINEDGIESPRVAVDFTVNELPNPVASSNSPVCNGGTLQLNSSGGYEFSWTGPNGFSSADDDPYIDNATELASGDYTVIVTGNNGCTSSQTISVIISPELNVKIGNVVNADCSGDETGSAIATATGGTGPYTYSWSNGQNIANATNLHAGGYTVTATDENGCTAQASTSIADPNEFNVIAADLENVSCRGEEDGSVTLFAEVGQIQDIFQNQPITLVAIFRNGVPYALPLAPFTDFIGLSLTVEDLPAGHYHFRTRNGNGCFASAEITIDEPTELIADVTLTTDASCNGEEDGTATVIPNGGTPPYKYYLFSTNNDPIGGPTITGLVAGEYTVIITDAEDCTFGTFVAIGEPDLLEATVSSTTNVSCNGGSDGSINIDVEGGTAPYSYDWTGAADGIEDQVNVLTAGTYSVIITDDNGCSVEIKDIVIGEPTLLTVTIAVDNNADCMGNESGQLTATAEGGTPGMGGYTYAWSNGDTDAIAEDLHAGGYIVVATDANGCTATAAAEITDPNGLLFGVTESTDVSCNGGDDGTATFGINGGTAPYYMIGYFGPNGEEVDLRMAPVEISTGYVFEGLSAGLYAIFVADANGCITANNINIHEPTLLIAEIIDIESESCPDAEDGSATVNAAGGTTGYEYEWTTLNDADEVVVVSTSNTATGLTAGQYTVVVTDEEECTAVAMVIIETNDDVAPQFVTTIPGDITVECDAVPEPFVVLPAWHTTDNCSDAENITVVYKADTIDIVCANTFTIKRTWTIFDEAGNSHFHIRKIYVQDTTKPEFTVPADVTIECDESTDPMNTGDVTDQTDNCSAPEDIDVVYDDLVELDGCGGYTGTITRTWTVTDECMNDSVAVQIITIEDTTKPVALCNSFTIKLDENGEASITADQVNNGSTDNCAMEMQLIYALDKMDFTCADIGENIVTLSVTDPCMNTGTCEATITVEDNIDPVITCPDDIVIQLGPGECEKVIFYDVTATDNCDVEVTQVGDLTFTSGDAFPIGGPYTLSYLATDEGDNTDDCSFTVTIIEFVPEDGDLACNPLVYISLDGDCEATIHPDQVLEGNNFHCYDDYEVTILDENGVEIPFATVDLSHVGQTLEVSVLDTDTGISCWGNLIVEDKVDPEMECPADTDVYCNGETDPHYTGEPTLLTCELSHEFTYEDDYTDYGCDGADDDSSVRARIIRTWTVTDDSGNSTSCDQIINILKPNIAEVIFPTDKDDIADDALDCGEVADNPSLTAPYYTGVPQYKGKDVVPGGICALSIGYEDTELYICSDGSSYEILRTWTIRNMCEPLEPGVNPIQHIQSIKVLDTTGPAIICPAPQTLIPSSSSCEVSVILPAADVSDDCSGYEVYIETASGQIINNNGGLIVDELFGLGEHTVTYHATDACGNKSSCEYTFYVEDLQQPIAVCDQHTVVGIGTDGHAEVEAITFDDGSYDNCGSLTYEVRRMDNPDCPGLDSTPFGPTVPFSCCDIGSVVMVELKVTDEAGLTNSCMVEVEVQDKIDPTIICPPNVIIECDDDLFDFDLVGEATATDNCGTPTVTYADQGAVDCGFGTITRIWTATDGYGRTSSCVQTIYVENSDPFYVSDTECRTFPLGNKHTLDDNVEWPCDIELPTCGFGLTPDDLETNANVNPLDARPQIFEGPCDNVAVTHEDTELEFGAADACLKILRNWIIIDWCTVNNVELNGHNPDPTDPATHGVWHYTQVIKVVNSTAPVITHFNGDTSIDNFDADCGDAFVAFDIVTKDDCTADEDLDISWEFSTGLSGNGTSASGAFANGSYSITFTVNDQCGNEYSESRDFTVQDAKKPTPVCIFGIATTVMPSAGQVTIWASDFESGSSYDNCTDYDDLEFSFSTDIDDKYVTITCADIPANGLYPITLYVTDEEGNFDFCTTFIDVQDPNGACANPTAVINGTIENEDQEVIQDVTVTLGDDNGPMTSIAPVTTGVDGAFQFNNGYGDYNVTPEKDINYLNGVTTYDLVLIAKHILGIETFDSPYKMIAADANNSQTITTLDIVKLRALILHIDEELSNNKSWRFVEQAYTFPNAQNPWAETFPEVADLDGSNINPVNFTAVKIGDVNMSATPNNLLGTDTRNFNGNLVFQLETTKVAAGETFTVDFKAKDFNVEGYQFSLGFDNSKVEFVDVTTNLEGLTARNFGLTKLSEGVITTSWNTSKAVKVEDNTTLFSMTFVANEALSTEKLFAVNSRYTEAEAYNGSDLYNVAIQVNGSEVANNFELFQNTPNPFKATTQIGFNLPEAGAVTLTIMDVSGRTLRLIEMDAAKGYNSVNLDRAEFDATGVLYYQLETATETATKKMILVD